MIRHLSISSVVGLIGASMLAGASATAAKEPVSVAIISFSPYAAWYIVKEKNLAPEIDLTVSIIEGITEKNAAITSGQVQCMNNTLDSMVAGRSGDLPIKVVAFSNMSYGLDKMIVAEGITTVEDFKGKSFGADFGFLNHMWMLLSLQRAGIDPSEMRHVVLLPQESAAAFSSGGLDIDVNYEPFASQSLTRAGSKIFTTSLDDRTWERGLISDTIACNEDWMKAKPEAARELLRAWFEAVNWWKENPAEGNAIVAKGLGWPESDVRLTQNGAVMLNISQNLGAFGLSGAKPLCEDLPAEAPRAPESANGWGALFDGEDCEAGYASATWDLFSDTYLKAGVIQKDVPAADGYDTSIMESLAGEKYQEKYLSNQWIGRLGL
ncbi:MAG: ABC transporter substrate-binding protein [Alphaproteobacteria bacterium]|nr:ABC transporter substrate-binding protein [Alphaproteobacteria bacterium]